MASVESRPATGVRRLKLRVGYSHERPDPHFFDFLSLRIMIDGRELLTSAGPRGPYIGPWPGAVLGEDSPLIPAQPPRRTLLSFRGVPEPGESTITAVTSATRRHVIWRDFRDCLAADSDEEDSGGCCSAWNPRAARG